jgi:ergothioneine biosynthesis protein EgtB
MPAAPVDPARSPSVARAGRDLLSLALIDARNRTLELLGAFEQASLRGLELPERHDVEIPVWLAGHIGWLAEHWIARNPQRGLGPACPVDAVRIASIDPQADAWFDPMLAPHGERWTLDLPGYEAVRAYLYETLESTLDLLERTEQGDDALHFFRASLFHEDLRLEQFVSIAQVAGVPLGIDLPPGTPARDALLVPAGRWMLGSTPGGFVPDVQKWAHEVEVPEFEIDAQPLAWAQYVEFVDDGGYDRQELWRPEGWAWLEREAALEGRRGPRFVEQIGVASGAVLRTAFGRSARMGGSQPVMHVSWWEADAYARWSGRRLPTEVEWEMAVHVAHRRGLRWGDVREWTASTLRPWAGFTPDPWTVGGDFDATAAFGSARVQRGASFCGSPRLVDPKLRRFAAPDRDDAFVGFRTCSW